MNDTKEYRINFSLIDDPLGLQFCTEFLVNLECLNDRDYLLRLANSAVRELEYRYEQSIENRKDKSE